MYTRRYDPKKRPATDDWALMMGLMADTDADDMADTLAGEWMCVAGELMCVRVGGGRWMWFRQVCVCVCVRRISIFLFCVCMWLVYTSIYAQTSACHRRTHRPTARPRKKKKPLQHPQTKRKRLRRCGRRLEYLPPFLPHRPRCRSRRASDGRHRLAMSRPDVRCHIYTHKLIQIYRNIEISVYTQSCKHIWCTDAITARSQTCQTLTCQTLIYHMYIYTHAKH